MRSRAYLFILVLLGIAHTSTAQTEMSAFPCSGSGISTTLATDYQAIGINPSNLGWSGKYEGKKVAFGLGDLGYSLYTDALDRDELKKDFVKGFDDKFSYAEKVAVAKDFTDAELTLNGDLRLFGVSLMTASAGGFAIHVADRFQWYNRFNRSTSEILYLGRTAPYFQHLLLADSTVIDNEPDLPQGTLDQVINGYNDRGEGKPISKLMEDAEVTMDWVREYALSWGYLIGTSGVVNWYGGASIRYLTGFAHADVGYEDGEFKAFSALSPGFDIDYGDAGLSNPSTRSGTIMTPVGSGVSGDIGFSTYIKNVVRVGVSYTNLGVMTWNGNVYTAQNDTLYELSSAGFDSYNIFDNADLVLGEHGILKWEGKKQEKIATPQQTRIGASYGIKEIAEVGFDVIIPTNKVAGNYEKPVYALGGQVSPKKFFTISLGMTTGGNYDTRVPMGLTLRLPTGVWEVGVATRDVISLFSQSTPTLSMCAGFLRFRV
ncbi:MAG: hypothetical protein H6594_07365 [Flavobacteriales bacterium]|nr:hypothetical protein [Flavobacteriales bacterium]